jgi:hypothetical protein
VQSLKYLTIVAAILVPTAQVFACDDFDDEMAMQAARDSYVAQSQTEPQQPPAATTTAAPPTTASVPAAETPLTLVSSPAPTGAQPAGQLQQ